MFLLGIYLYRIDWCITGMILLVVGLFFLLVGCFLIYDELPTKKNIERQRKINNSIEKEKANEIRRYKERIESYKKEIKEMTSAYGEITKEIRYRKSQYKQYGMYDFCNLVHRLYSLDSFKSGIDSYYSLSKEEQNKITADFCSCDNYINSFSRKKDTVYIFESSSILIINNNPYNFKDIISFEVMDNSRL